MKSGQGDNEGPSADNAKLMYRIDRRLWQQSEAPGIASLVPAVVSSPDVLLCLRSVKERMACEPKG
jgi:hypothetical protein